jgi:hypothetical protein
MCSVRRSSAGELALPWVVVTERNLNLRDMAQIIAPYPTWGEIDKPAAAEFSRALLRHPLIRGLRPHVVASA